MQKDIVRWAVFGIWIGCLFSVISPRAFAEGNCSACVYSDNQCRNVISGTGCLSPGCPQVYCVDTSSDGDGSQYQCCGYSVPEFNGVVGSILILTVFVAALAWKRRRRAALAVVDHGTH